MTASTAQERPVKVLLVDDHKVFPEVLAMRLRVDTMVDAAEVAFSLNAARAILSRFRPDLVLLDYQLVDEIGLGLFPDLLRLPEPPKVLMLSGSDATHQIVQARQTGQVIGALPPQQWVPHIDAVTRGLELPPGMLHLEVADAGTAWANDPAQAVAQRLAELRPTTPGERDAREQNTRVDATSRMSAADHQLAARQRYVLRPTAPTVAQDEQELGLAPQVDPRHSPRR